jgi:predicted SpoU family rRNA methylase
MENKHIYAKGLYFNRVKPETPEKIKAWKKGGASVHIENFTAQLQELKEHANEKGYLNFDLVEGEYNGEKRLSFRLNTWKPEKKELKSDETPW